MSTRACAYSLKNVKRRRLALLVKEEPLFVACSDMPDEELAGLLYGNFESTLTRIRRQKGNQRLCSCVMKDRIMKDKAAWKITIVRKIEVIDELPQTVFDVRVQQITAVLGGVRKKECGMFRIGSKVILARNCSGSYKGITKFHKCNFYRLWKYLESQ